MATLTDPNKFVTPETGETTTADDGTITSTGYTGTGGSKIDLTPLNQNDVLPDKDYSGYTGGLLSSGNASTPTGSDSVSENLNNLMDRNSRYLKQAEGFANQQANRRGLLNSSMAVGAAEDARIRAALPIAQQDAQTQAGYNQQQAQTYYDLAKGQQAGNVEAYANQLRGSYALRGQELSQEQALQLAREQMAFQGQESQLDRQHQYGMTEFQTDQQLRLMQQDAWNRENLQLLQGEQQERLANLDGQWKNLFQSSASASSFYSEVQEQISEIMRNADIPGTSKQTYINQMIDNLESGLTVIGAIADLDLARLLDFTGTAPVPR